MDGAPAAEAAAAAVVVAETARLRLRRLTEGDAPLMLELLNDPAWLRGIGDRHVRTLDEARAYLQRGALADYARLGFGPLCVELRASGDAIGICGLFQRAALPQPDLGYALLSRAHGRGLATEAAAAVLAWARRDLRLARVLAVVAPHNAASARVLEKLGFRAEGEVELAPGDRARLFARDLGSDHDAQP